MNARLADLLVVVGFVAAWLLLSPCSRWSLWKRGSCARPPEPPPRDGP